MSAATKTMQALVKTQSAPGLTLQEVSVPAVGDDEVLIRVLKTAICGTDVHIYNWDEWAQRTVPVPMTIGHEFVGRVAAVGARVRDLYVDELVTGEGHVVCGHCRNCRAGRRHLCANTSSVGSNRPGAFAEYLALPAANVWQADPSIPLDTLAVFDPLGNAVHTALSFDLVGEDVLITGAGPVGIMAVAVCRHAGARYVVVTDVNPYRLGIAAQMGADRCVDVSQQSVTDAMADLGMTEGFDVGLEMSGNVTALQGMLAAMAHGGKIALLGFLEHQAAVDWENVIFKGLTLKGIYGREMFETWYKMTAMVQSGLDVSQVITHHFAVADYEKAFDIMCSGHSGKVILEWPAAHEQ
ncbi:MAG: L-threonine 3-dehydrogenase [Thermoleophilia bacterium]|jgi:threonine 3-dehydrogenase